MNTLKFLPDSLFEYRIIWMEIMSTMDGPWLMPCSGIVYWAPKQELLRELEMRSSQWKLVHVRLDMRPASTESWEIDPGFRLLAKRGTDLLRSGTIRHPREMIVIVEDECL